MTWVRHTFEFVVQETHLDSFGHMNNAVYLEIFENARWDFIHNRGFGYKHIQQEYKSVRRFLKSKSNSKRIAFASKG